MTTTGGAAAIKNTFYKLVIKCLTTRDGAAPIQTSHVKQFIKTIILAPITQLITSICAWKQKNQCFDTWGWIFKSKLSFVLIFCFFYLIHPPPKTTIKNLLTSLFNICLRQINQSLNIYHIVTYILIPTCVTCLICPAQS